MTCRVVKEMFAEKNADFFSGHHIAEADGTGVVAALDELRVLRQSDSGDGLDDSFSGALETQRGEREFSNGNINTQ